MKMKKLLLTLMLAIISSSAAAEWALVQTGKESNKFVGVFAGILNVKNN
jgi:hypothetical protein